MNIAFLPTALACASLPFRDPNSNLWTRDPPRYPLRLENPSGRGIPWGSYARLFAMWLTREAKLTKSRDIEIRGSYAAFLKSLGLGSDHKTRNGFINQVERFLTCSMSLSNSGPLFPISESYDLWWNRHLRKFDHDTLFTTRIKLSDAFFQQTQSAMPINFSDVSRLRRSPFQIDIYTWLNHRFFSLRDPATIRYPALHRQFGCSLKAPYHFRQEFNKNLKAVRNVFIQANVEVGEQAVTLFASRTSVPKRGGNMVLPFPQFPVENSTCPRENADEPHGKTLINQCEKTDTLPAGWTSLTQTLMLLRK